MDMTSFLLILLIIISLMSFIFSFLNRKDLHYISSQFQRLKDDFTETKTIIKGIHDSVQSEFQQSRKELHENFAINRKELKEGLNEFGNQFDKNTSNLNNLIKERLSDLKQEVQLKFDRFEKQLSEKNEMMTNNVKDIRQTVEKQLKDVREDNNKQLEQMRITVDEKLQKTLNDRLSKSFETVNQQLKSVQEGLGEMKTLANDVGGLKKVLSNVKMRGGFGEVQLEMLLENILAPSQFEKNVKTNPSYNGTVEFAIKLPGKSTEQSVVWLPIDAKFPKDVYEQLQSAHDSGDIEAIEKAQKNLYTTIKEMAKSISSKYISPPNTTDFAILFLPFEGIYGEVVRKSDLLQELQSKYKIIVTGPTTLAAILNSLQMGFRTLAIQKRSGEVWNILSEVKKEFEKFGGILQKAKKNIQTGLNQMDELVGTRTNVINRKLRGIGTSGEEELPSPEKNLNIDLPLPPEDIEE